MLEPLPFSVVQLCKTGRILVSRLTTTVTALFFFVISMLQSSISCLCVPVGYEWRTTAAVVEQEAAKCESRCPTENRCAEPKCASVKPQAPSTRLDFSDSCETFTSGCGCEYVIVHLEAVREERRDQAPEAPDGNLIPSGVSLTESKISSFPSRSRPQGLHPTISTTVLRC